MTGTHGAARHLGNAVLGGSGDPEAIDTAAGANVVDLAGRFDTERCLSGHSDLAALMVLEHQAQAHNLITSAGYQARLALSYQAAMNEMDGRPADEVTDSTRRRFEAAAKPLLRYLLSIEEARLAEPIRGTSGFAEEYSKRGPRDRRGRSLYQLDLKSRLFRHPLSPLVYSEAFDSFPAPFQEHIDRRLWEILSGKDTSPDFAAFSADDRRAVLEILAEAKKGLPDYWKAGERAQSERAEL